MKKNWIIAALMTLPFLAPAASAQETVKIGLISDAAYEAAGWALANGKVSDPAVKTTVEFLPIPAMMQAAMTGAFDIMPNGVLAVPQLGQSGVETKILGSILRYNPPGHACDIWVPANSPMKEPKDLKGKRIAVTSIESQNVVSIRAILSEKYGLKTDPVGGDITWVEIPQAQFEAALASGQVDGVAFGNVQAISAAKNGHRSIVHGSEELEAMYGGPMVSVVLTASKAKLDAQPAAYKAAAALLKKSADYARAHTDEVFAAVAPKYKISVDDLKVYFTENTTIPFALGATDAAVIEKAWASGYKLGALESLPENAESFIWDGAAKE